MWTAEIHVPVGGGRKNIVVSFCSIAVVTDQREFATGGDTRRYRNGCDIRTDKKRDGSGYIAQLLGHGIGTNRKYDAW